MSFIAIFLSTVLSVRNWSFISRLPSMHPLCFLSRVFIVQVNSKFLHLSLLLKFYTSVEEMWLKWFFLQSFSWIFLKEYSATICHSCRQAVISHQDFVRLNTNPFMKIAKIFNPITLNAILPWNFPVKYLPFLFCCVLINYDQSFLSFPRSFLKSFSHCPCSLCPFPMLQISPQNLLLSSVSGTSSGLTPISLIST